MTDNERNYPDNFDTHLETQQDFSGTRNTNYDYYSDYNKGQRRKKNRRNKGKRRRSEKESWLNSKY